jgi:hypothetical protein
MLTKFETKFTFVELGHDSIGQASLGKRVAGEAELWKDDARKVELG